MSTPEQNPAELPAEGAEAEPKPVLASEALKDDLAPVEPWSRRSRYWCAGLGLLFAGFAVPPVAHALTVHPYMALGLALVTLVLAIAPVGYATRAALMALAAVSSVVLGLARSGPLAALGDSVQFWGLLHLVAATGLASALLFRQRYPAYVGARYVLATGLTVALPFIGYCAVLLTQAALAIQIAAALSLTAIGFSLLGFMGARIRVAGSYVGAAVILSVTSLLITETAVALLSYQPVAQVIFRTASVLCFAGAASLAALGIFQLLAARHWADAREIDVHAPDGDTSEVRALGDSWSSGE